jgi:hypothetical protein
MGYIRQLANTYWATWPPGAGSGAPYIHRLADEYTGSRGRDPEPQYIHRWCGTDKRNILYLSVPHHRWTYFTFVGTCALRYDDKRNQLTPLNMHLCRWHKVEEKSKNTSKLTKGFTVGVVNDTRSARSGFESRWEHWVMPQFEVELSKVSQLVFRWIVPTGAKLSDKIST